MASMIVEQIVRGRPGYDADIRAASAQLAGDADRQALGEADDVGERRAQLIGDVGKEIGLQPVGGLQRLGALAQGILDARRVGDIDIGEKRVAVGKRHRGEAEHHAVGPRDALLERLAAAYRGGDGNI